MKIFWRSETETFQICVSFLPSIKLNVLVHYETISWKAKPNNNPGLLIGGVISNTRHDLYERICQTRPVNAI